MSLTSDKSKSVQNVAEEENVQNNLSDTTDTDTDSKTLTSTERTTHHYIYSCYVYGFLVIFCFVVRC